MNHKPLTQMQAEVKPLDFEMIGRLVALETTCSLILKLITGGNAQVLDTQLDRLVVAWSSNLQAVRAMKPEMGDLYLAYEAQITRTLTSIFADAKRETEPTRDGT